MFLERSIVGSREIAKKFISGHEQLVNGDSEYKSIRGEVLKQVVNRFNWRGNCSIGVLTLVFWIERLILGRRSSNDRESRTQPMRMLVWRRALVDRCRGTLGIN